MFEKTLFKTKKILLFRNFFLSEVIGQYRKRGMPSKGN
jgi:hypothetical protein